MAEMVDDKERRQAQRFSCVGEAEIVVPGNGLRYRGRIANLSATGCFIETHCRLERGTAVEVWMKTEGVPLRVAANLLVRRGEGVGLRFHSVSGRRRAQIEELIAELEAMSELASRPQGEIPERKAGAGPEAEDEGWPDAEIYGGPEAEIYGWQAERDAEPVELGAAPAEEARWCLCVWLRNLYSLCARWTESLFRRKATP